MNISEMLFFFQKNRQQFRNKITTNSLNITKHIYKEQYIWVLNQSYFPDHSFETTVNNSETQLQRMV